MPCDIRSVDLSLGMADIMQELWGICTLMEQQLEARCYPWWTFDDDRHPKLWTWPDKHRYLQCSCLHMC